jgi:hypothetical protein
MRQAAEVSSKHRSEPVAREKGASSGSHHEVRPTQEDQRVTRSQAAPGGPHASEERADPPHRDDPPRWSAGRDSFSRHSSDDAPRRDPDSSKRWSSPKARSIPPSSTPSASQGGLQVLPHSVSGAVEPRPCRSPSPWVETGGQPPAWRRAKRQPPSREGTKALPPSRRGLEANPRASGASRTDLRADGGQKASPESGSSYRPVKGARIRSSM